MSVGACAFAAVVFAAAAMAQLPLGGASGMSEALTAMPAGYELQFCDDCGVPEHQPHVRADGVHEYSPAVVNADAKARTVAWGWRQVRAVYEGLRPDLDYVLAVTYANEPYNNRVQSLWADGMQIHGPHPLPKGGAERLVFRLPREALRDGRLDLEFRMEAEVNAVVSVIELWGPAPGSRELHLDLMPALVGDLEGYVLDAAWEPVAGAQVFLKLLDGDQILAKAQTLENGRFVFPREAFAGLQPRDLEVVGEHKGLTVRRVVRAADLTYSPLRYRPIPVREPGVKAVEVSLDGDWWLNPEPGKAVRLSPLGESDWHRFRVPGQFVEQGYDVPREKPVVLAREFEVPADWAGRRMILRFDAIHAGARYFVNGRQVGDSQNLFTPVELDVTDAVRPGEANRLDVEMLVDTISERLSYASGYAFHNLGGVHRSVHLFVLPAVHIRHLRVTQDVDADYRGATLTVEADVENCTRRAAQGLLFGIRLYGPEGAQVGLGGASRAEIGTLAAGARTTVRLAARVPDPQKWSAEKPMLYRLVVELGQDRRLLERVERYIGFRKIELREGQLWVNGRRVKLAGANHHEIDPLTGRADTMRHAEEDVRLMKAANLNYLRTSHYPPTRELLDAADRLGMYVEVEAPFCWVTGDPHDAAHLRAVLDATAAMVDYHGDHPSVLIWSLANESQFNWLFEQSHKLVKGLDPSRPTTFNNPDPKRICDIANLHYPSMPYDQHLPDDPRPILIDEYFFPVCHEQTDVAINPGLRELWGAGHSDPDSPWGRECAASFQVYSGPGAPPGAWPHIVHSNRVIGGAIWAFIDDSFYLPDGRHVGYSWVHGFWGLVDAWRRPKPEWWLAKLIFSPVWFPTRRLPFRPGAKTVAVPVENHYSFTNLSELTIEWELRGHRGHVVADVPPGSTGELRIPVAKEAVEGDVVIVRVRDARGELVNVAGLQLGERQPHAVAMPGAGPPRWDDDGQTITIGGDDFTLVVDRKTGQFCPTDPRYRAAVIEFPSVHLTRFDFGDLVPSAPPYAVLPDPATRAVEAVEVRQLPHAVELTVRDRYADLAGTVRWVMDRAGTGRVSADYTYTGNDFYAREVGLRFLLRPGCETLTWRRWSEWTVYPADSISRTEGTAHAHRDPALGDGDERTPPRWPWALDETDLGTNDFRGVKLNIYEASLTAGEGDGLHVSADADRHVRACLDPRGVWLHVLTQCRLGPIMLHKGHRITADCAVRLLPRR